MTIALLDYGGGGNLHSMRKALERAAAEAGLGQTVRTVRDPDAVARAERIVLPGQGAFADCKRGLAELPGILEALEDAVIRRGRPFLGTCIGMQLMATTSHENGLHAGFGWVPGEVVRIAPQESADMVRGANGGSIWPPTGRWWVPHYGWNDLAAKQADHPLLAGLGTGSHFYFVHSYHLQVQDRRHLLGTADYGGPITAAVARDNLVGTQFHPEKSQAAGIRLLTNFLRWAP